MARLNRGQLCLKEESCIIIPITCRITSIKLPKIYDFPLEKMINNAKRSSEHLGGA